MTHRKADGGERVPALLRTAHDGLRFFAASVRRHALMVAAMAGLVALLAALGASVMPPRYKAEVELTSPRAAPGEEGLEKPLDPAHAALEIVYSDETLFAMVGETGLAQAFAASRSPLLRWKDAVLAKVRGPLTDRDIEEALVKMLAARIGYEQGDDTITLSASWTDANTALRLADAVALAFLRARHDAEVTAMAETISILEQHLEEERAVVTQLERSAGRAAAPHAGALDTAVFDERTRLGLEMRKYNALLDRVEEARIAMEKADAGFRRRYGVVKPAQLPRAPDAPAFWPIVGAALLAGALLGALSAAALDAVSGVAFEPWQVERALRLQVVGEVPAP